MEFENALTAWAAQNADLQALIGEENRFRFFKAKVPQGSRYPVIVQQRTGTGRQYRPCRVDGAVEVSLQVDHYAKNWQDMDALSRAFREMLDPSAFSSGPVLMGTVHDSPASGVRVRGAFLENEFDSDDPDPGLLRRTQMWTFWVSEP